MKIRVNWRQGKIASDRLVRVHKILDKQPAICQFERMKKYDVFSNEEDAKKEIRRRGYSKYKRCKFCWDGRIVEI